MRSVRIFKMLFLGIFLFCSNTYGQGKNNITVEGRNFELNGEKFEFTGVSFFNAIYNPEFNKDSQTRREWIRKFKDSGINVLRVWCQWDNARGFVDSIRSYNPYL